MEVPSEPTPQPGADGAGAVPVGDGVRAGAPAWSLSTRQKSQVPHFGPLTTATREPVSMPQSCRASSSIAAMRPTDSWPGMTGYSSKPCFRRGAVISLDVATAHSRSPPPGGERRPYRASSTSGKLLGLDVPIGNQDCRSYAHRALLSRCSSRVGEDDDGAPSLPPTYSKGAAPVRASGPPRCRNPGLHLAMRDRSQGATSWATISLTLIGKAAIVIGATKGMGAAIADRFAASGARVTINSRTATGRIGLRERAQPDVRAGRPGSGRGSW